ncbi:hypothetical protein HY932_02970 [Candidatus Falkowbacteria bacterium]|nr:hypothetical protein [Candidatus Falkowbacteria bacterium]
MKQLIQKVSLHGQRSVRFSLVILVVLLAIIGFVDWPLFSLANEIDMNTPIVHVYKISQTTPEPATPAVEPTTTTTTEPAKAEPTKTVKPLPATTEPAQQTNVVEPSQPATPSEQTQKVEYKEAEEQTEIEFVDPREVQNALQDIKRMQADLKRFLKQVKKLPNSADDIAAINDFLSQLAGHYKNIKSPTEDTSLRGALQEFWDARLWEEVDKIRAKVELPKELTNIAKDLKKAKKLITQKAFTKLGLDMTAIAGYLAETETAYNEAKAFYDQGNMEDAQLAMEVIHGGLHPGEIMGVLYQMREIKDRVRSVKNKEVKQIIDELLADVIESANGGDFRDANQILNDIRAELMKIMQKYIKTSGTLDDKTRTKLEQLENLVSEKLSQEPKEELQMKKEE